MVRQAKLDGDTVDVLLLHGLSKDLVAFLNEFLSALGARSSTVLDLPSRRKPQESRVDHYIKHCRLPLVLMTFDETEKRTKNARPNVYHELTRCRSLRPNDTIVLREKRGRTLVKLPSNVEGHLVIIEFDRAELHKMIPHLLTELRSRGVMRAPGSEKESIGAGRILNKFLDEMDRIWDDELTDAWDKIHRQDYVAERSCAVQLDYFFQHYQSVFDALIRKKKRGEELRAACDGALADSRECAVATWKAVAEGKLRIADDIAGDPEMKKKTHRHQDVYERAAGEMNEGQKRALTAKEQLQHFKRAIELVDQYLKVTRASAGLVGRSR